MLEINEGHNKVKKTKNDHSKTICSDYTQEEDLVEERRKIFGEEEYCSAASRNSEDPE